MPEKSKKVVTWEQAGASSNDDISLGDRVARWSSFLGEIKWFNFTMLVLIPFWAFLQVQSVIFYPKTMALCCFYYFITLCSITAGYHRLWAHRSYSASPLLKYLLAAFGAGAVQGSIKFWVREHRAHHRYTDTDRDPYNIQKGFWHAHILWVLVKQPKKNNRVDISDIMHDRIVVWQHKYYFIAALIMGWALPALVAGLGWNDWYGGFLYAGILRSFFVNQATFCVNSLAHYLGEQPFDDRRSPRDHILTAIITMGEGYHNYHHSFPSDYRNGIEWYHLDPTKWMISALDWAGLAYDLKRFRQNEIDVGRIQQSYKKLEKKGRDLNWGTPIEQLPTMIWSEYQKRVGAGESLVVIEGIVHDVSSFRQEHPGGEIMIRSALGSDATGLFNGAVYDHSSAARNMLATLRVAILLGGGEVESLKSPQISPST